MIDQRFRSVGARIGLSPAEVRWIGALVALELLLIAVYFGATDARVTGLRYILYPFVWINVGLWAAWRITPPQVGQRSRGVAAGVAGAYFLLLCAVAGLISFQAGHASNGGGLRLLMASPGWGPALVYVGPTLRLAAVPYLLIGYLSLAYLVYATILEAAGAAASGLLGVASCVGCAFPVIASLAAGIAGGSSALTAAVYALSIDLSTAVFVLAVALLYWRPGFGSDHPSDSSR